MNAIELYTWLKPKLGVDFTELPNLPVSLQLANYDNTQCGVGFVFVLSMTYAENESDEDPERNFEMESIPVIRMRGNWYTFDDDNIADIMRAIIRMITPEGEDDISEIQDGSI